jgi:hypothetical protein
MKKSILLLLTILGSTFCFAQGEGLGAKMEALTETWDQEAEKLSTYQGLTEFCLNAVYREEVISTLKGIHHYDSVLYDIIAKKARFGNNAEMKKTLKDITKAESESSIRSFLVFLQEECNTRKDIEQNAKKTGEDKDSEVYMLETELAKYVKQITKRIDTIRDHVHHLNIK